MKILGIVFCMISQGQKGSYMTMLPVYKQDKMYYYVRSDGDVLKEKGNKPLYKIDKRVCRQMARYR